MTMINSSFCKTQVRLLSQDRKAAADGVEARDDGIRTPSLSGNAVSVQSYKETAFHAAWRLKTRRYDLCSKDEDCHVRSHR